MRLDQPANAKQTSCRQVSEQEREWVFLFGSEDSPQPAAESFNSAATHRPYRRFFLFSLSILLLLLPAYILYAQGDAKSYVGAEACKACHEKEYASFTTHSTMSRSFRSVEIRKRKLTADEAQKCSECHTTGYGKPGGFKSESETPHLKNVGCESCHGPGSVHATSSDPKMINRHVEVKDCEGCHDKDRVAAFSHKPLLFGGAH